MVKWIDWDEFIVPIKIYIFDVTDTWKRLDNSTGQNSEHKCHVEYEVEYCSASGMADNGCTDIKRTSVSLPTGGYVIYIIISCGILYDLPDLMIFYGDVSGIVTHKKKYFTRIHFLSDGQVLYSSLPTYGQRKEAGNEAGYIVGMSTCYPQPGSVKINDMRLILESNYSNAQRHTRVMGLFYILVAD
ncbi:uncharacterized protein LOC126704382 [Quercus robur]|uniref:uncharacterized protein LOC126704382 n=1 Tax=Quercus robur TaxID=38942 RepID=UPI0021631ACA|nr:uncharacterized protein LOC126704382 [Quercus robur]